MKRTTTFFALAAAAMLSSAQAATITLNPIADAFVFEDLPSANYGGASPLYVGRNEFLKEYLALLRFDLSFIPAGATVSSAQLQLRLVHSEGAVGPLSVSVSKVAVGWNEGTVTWNTLPTMTAGYGTASVPYSEDATVAWDVLPLVTEWLAAPAAERSLALRGPGEYGLRQFTSREGTQQPPQLIVNYTLPTFLVSAGSIWRYLDDGSDQGTFWRSPNFGGDANWPSGPAELGFGDGDEQTQLQSGDVTYYFRHTFTVTNVAGISNLQMRLKSDDGAIVHLNGTEIFRSNMPTGRIDYLTLAASAVSGADETNYFHYPPVPDILPLVEGQNVLAVEVHQASPNDGDLSFVLELVKFTPPPDPPGIVAQPQSQTVTEGDPATFSVTTTGRPPFTYLWRKNGTPIAEATNYFLTIAQTTTNDAGTYSVLVANAFGSVLSSSAVLTVALGSCPVVLCPANIVTNCNGPGGTVVTFSPTGGNPCNPSDFEIVCTPPSGSAFPPGTTVVQCVGRAPASGRQSPCSFAVTVSTNCPPCSPNLLVNGSFESPGSPEGWIDVLGGSSLIPGWTTLLNGLEYYNPTANRWGAHDGAARDGDFCVDLTPFDRTGGGIAQTFNTVPGRVYHVCFFLSTIQRTGRDGTGSLVVTAPGLTRAYTAENHSSVHLWQLQRFDFVATSASSTLGFTSTNDWQTHFIMIDKVCVSDCCLELICPPPLMVDCQTPNGAPATWSLFATNHCGSNVSVYSFPPSGAWFPPGTWPVDTFAVARVGSEYVTNQCQFNVTVLSNCPPPSCSPNLLVNGSFELPGLPDEYRYVAGGSAFITGWKTLLNGVEYSDPRSLRPEVMQAGVAADGVYTVDLGVLSFAGGGIEQTFPTVPNHEYRVSFKLGTYGLHGRDGTASLTAEADWGTGAPHSESFSTADPGPTIKWSLKHFTFTTPATGTETTLRLTSNNDGDTHFVILDDVRVSDCCDQIDCPPNLVVSCQGNGGATVDYAILNRTICSGAVLPISHGCEPPSGSFFPVGTTPVTCLDSNRVTGEIIARCGFTVTVLSNCPPAFTENWESRTGNTTVTNSSSIMGGGATISSTPTGRMTIYQPGVFDFNLGVFGNAQTSDGTKGLGVHGATVTINFLSPVHDFGAYWGVESFGGPAQVSLTFSDGSTTNFTYGGTTTGQLQWHSWHFAVAITNVSFSSPGTRFVIDGLQAGPLVTCRPNFLVNGSFEYPGVPDDYVALPGLRNDITGWFTLDNGVEYYTPFGVTEDVSTGFAADGDHALDLAVPGGGGIAQPFITTPGNAYRVEFKMGTARDKGRTGAARLTATVSGSAPRLFGVATDSPTIQWERKSFTFTATVPFTTLSFTTTDDPAQSFVNLDDVRVTDCPPDFCIDANCPPEVTAECTNAAGTVVNFEVTGVNRCFPLNPVNVTCTPPSGTAFPKGMTPVRCEFVSQVGAGLETNVCSFEVIVSDTTPPEVTCSLEKTVECGSEWNFEPPMAFDACCGIVIEDLGGTTNVVEGQSCQYTYTHSWKATDCDGSSRECTQVVHGMDSRPPSVTCLTNKTIRVDSSGRAMPAYSILHSFGIGGDDRHPAGALVEGDDGALYGNGSTTLFSLQKDGTRYRTIHEFPAFPGDGSFPQGSHSLINGVGRVLYGTTSEGGGIGGIASSGIVFKVTYDGVDYRILRCFDNPSINNPSWLLQGRDGILYGTTPYHPFVVSNAAIFSMNPECSDGELLALRRFGGYFNFIGATLIEASDGVLYGIVQEGGGGEHGRVFKLNRDGSSYTPLKDFAITTSARYVSSDLLEATDGVSTERVLFGIFSNGRSFEDALVFRLNRSGGGYTELHSFPSPTEMHLTSVRLIEGTDGRLYGTVASGGIFGKGVLFRLNKDGSGYTVLHDFSAYAEDGTSPLGLVEASDGVLYGITRGGGSFGDSGTVFRFDPRPSWDTEQPTAVDACSGTNVTIVELPRITDGTCPQIITRTWTVTDTCGNSTNCSQTVTVYGDCVQIFAGLTNAPLGSAILEVESDELVIRNFSNLGVDGVGLGIGAAQSASVGFECLDPDALPTGASVAFRAIGEVNGTNDQLVAEFKATDAGNDIVYSCDFPWLRGAPLLALVYDSNRLVAVAHGLSNVFANVTGLAGDARITPYLPQGGRPWMLLDWPGSRPFITLTGGQPVPGNRIAVAPDVTKLSFPDITFDVSNVVTRTGLDFWWSPLGPLGPGGNPGDPAPYHAFIGSLARLEVLAAYVPEVRILSEQVGQFGLTHEAVGQALIAGAEHALVISSPMSPEGSGVDIIAERTEDWGSASIEWINLYVDPAGPQGARIIASVLGSSNEILAGIEVRSSSPGTLSVNPLPPAVSSNLYQVAMWRDGSPVATIAASNNTPATVDVWPLRFGIEMPYPPTPPPPNDPGFPTVIPQLSLQWPSNVSFNLDGVGSVTGDELRVVGYVNIPNPPYFPKTIGLRMGGGLSGLEIINEKIAPAGLVYRGLAHQPISNATLEVVSSELVVSNRAGASSFGASVVLGDAGYGVVQVGDFSDADPNGASIHVRAEGTLDGVPGQYLGALVATKSGSNTLFTADRSRLGGDASVISVYDGPILVKTSVNLSNPVVRVPDRLRLGWRADPIWRMGPGSIPTLIEFPERVSIIVADDAAVTGDRVSISGFDPDHTNRTDVGSVSSLEIVGTGLNSFRVFDGELGMFHRGHQALGGTRLLVIGDALRVDHFADYLDPAGPAGVRFPLNNADTFSAWWRTLDRFHPAPPPDALIRIGGDGAFVGGQEQPLDSSQITLIGDTKEITSECIALGASSRRTEVYRNAALVLTTSISGNTGVVAQVRDWPVGAGKMIVGPDGTLADVYWRWLPATQFTINGQMVDGDELRIIAENVPPLDHLSSFTLRAAGFPEINFVADIAQTTAPVTAKAQAAGGALVISWDVANPRQVLQQADNPAGPWTDVPGATSSPYLVNPVGAKKFLRVFQK